MPQFLQCLADRQKVIASISPDYDTLYQVWLNSDENRRRSSVTKIVESEILRSALNDPQTKLKELGIKSILHTCTIGPRVPNFRPFRSTISGF